MLAVVAAFCFRMPQAKLQPQLPKLLVPAQGYTYDKHTGSCTFAPNPEARKAWNAQTVVFHGLGSILVSTGLWVSGLQLPFSK
jgi:hypothetical protein